MKDDKLNRLASVIIKAIDERMQKKPKAYYTEAEVLTVDKSNGIAYVHIPGGVAETPVKLTIDASEGDTVQVRVGEGSATITGNMTAPPTDDKKANTALMEVTAAKKKLLKIDKKIEDGDFEAAELSNIVTLYCLSTSNSQFIQASGYDWQATVPAYAPGLYYWTKTVTTMDDGTTIETEPIFNLTAQMAAEADAIASSNDNHFWHDSSGVYVTKQANNASSGYSTRIVSEGIQHTYNGNNLFTLSSSGLTFYQSNGSTPMATYGSTGTTLYANGDKAAEFLTGGINLYDPGSTTYPAAQFTSSGAVIGKDYSNQIVIDGDGIKFDYAQNSHPAVFGVSPYSSYGIALTLDAARFYVNTPVEFNYIVYADSMNTGDISADDITAKSVTARNIQHGSCSIIIQSANTPASMAVTFGQTFASTPNVVISPQSSAVGTNITGCGATNISTTGFTAWVTRTNTTTTTLNWIAIG